MTAKLLNFHRPEKTDAFLDSFKDKAMAPDTFVKLLVIGIRKDGMIEYGWTEGTGMTHSLGMLQVLQFKLLREGERLDEG